MEKIVPKIGDVIDTIHNSQFTAGERSRLTLLKRLFSPTSTTARRVRAFCNIGGAFMPGFEKRLARSLTDLTLLGDEGFEPYCIGYGEEQTVFRVAEDTVKKVDRHSLGGSAAYLERRVKSLLSAHLMLKGLFSFNPSIVMNESFEPGSSHLRFFNAVIATQRYIDDPQDFYQDVTIEEGRRMAQADPVFARQVEFFQAQFVRNLNLLNVCPDILGAKNLSVVQDQEGFRLQLLDAHMMHDANQWSDVQAERKIRRQNKRLDHLRAMLD